ncbi:hypothetical protein C6W88_18480 [Halomonas litopenaei]|uniref:Uncharacterized protein n=1 Tax=Halomonas litopenaei TaxID=2109328 RepID=A0ABX5ISI1_9GAMM|nr:MULTISPECIES: hypothetical protein [Halomonas]PTL89647.1 hypothetical protein C6W89_16480 [Halomonas sp. SYSU XM8]PTL92029.1 hypothetical protein C6W88_18480 [Halomonas litopenaei]
MEEEKNGLELLFKGVTVEMTWEKYDEAFESRGPAPLDGRWEDISKIATNDIKINILVTVPDLEGMELGLKLEIGEEKNDDYAVLFIENHIKTVAPTILEERDGGNLSNEESLNIEILKNNSYHCISIEKHMHSNIPPKPLTLHVGSINQNRPIDIKTDSFTMRI